MHELSIALSMIDVATEEATKRGATRVTALHLKLGPLSGVVKDALLFSYEIACEGTLLEGSQLIIEDVPVVIYCVACKSEHLVEALRDLRCPSCGSSTVDVRTGRELQVVALELEEAEAFVS